MKPILADLLMVLHFLWAAFMVLGLPIGLLVRSRALRWTHFAGMLATSLVAATCAFCPLTLAEEFLHRYSDPGFTYRGSFLAHHISRVLYPGLEPWVLRAATIAWGASTCLAMVIVPPGRGPRKIQQPGECVPEHEQQKGCQE